MKVLLLAGSAKQPRSTSEALGTHLLERLRERGAETRTLQIHRQLHAEGKREELLAAVDEADLLVLAFPLYVDSLPYLVTRTLEWIAARRKASSSAPARAQRIATIVNCGFPEARNNEIAVAICRRFARETGIEWAGALSLGGGEALGARPPREAGWIARNVVRALDLAAEALAGGDPIPEEATALMSQPVVPRWLYTLIGDLSFFRLARRHGVAGRLGDRPYDRPIAPRAENRK